MKLSGWAVGTKWHLSVKTNPCFKKCFLNDLGGFFLIRAWYCLRGRTKGGLASHFPGWNVPVYLTWVCSFNILYLTRATECYCSEVLKIKKIDRAMVPLSKSNKWLLALLSLFRHSQLEHMLGLYCLCQAKNVDKHRSIISVNYTIKPCFCVIGLCIQTLRQFKQR